MKNRQKGIGQILAASSLLLFASACVTDANYNLNSIQEVDATMHLFENGLSLPIGKMEPMTLDTAFSKADFKDLDKILKKDENGHYSLKTDGAYNLDEMIEELHLKEMGSINGASLKIDTTYKLSQIAPAIPSGISVQVGDVSKSLNTEWKDVVFFDKDAMSKFPKNIVSIDEAVLEGANAIIEIKVSGLPTIEGKYYLKDTKVELPSFLLGENDKSVLILDDNIEISNDNAVTQTVTLEKLANMQIEGKTEISGTIKLFSTLYSQNPTIQPSALNNDITVVVKIGIGNGTGADHPGKIAISKAVVKVGYDFEQNQTISFGEVPEEFQKEDINFALNPQMRITLATNFGAPVSGDFVLTPYIGGKAQTSVTVKGIEMPCSDDWQKTKTNKYVIGAAVEAEKDEILIPTDLSPLLKRIPDSITVAIKVGIDKTKQCTIFPAADYTCNMNYGFEVPLSFGEGFNLKFTSEGEVEAESDQYLQKVSKFNITGEYANTLPVGVTLKLTFFDDKGSEIAMKEASQLKLAASADGKSEKCGEMSLVVSPKDPTNMKLRKILFTFTLDATKDVALQKDQYLRLDNLKLFLPEGITIKAEEK